MIPLMADVDTGLDDALALAFLARCDRRSTCGR